MPLPTVGQLELVKENVQPLKRGRAVASDESAANAAAPSADSLAAERACVPPQ